tara:strand:+ start:284 stop:490 length:207 start_codon:yes stop_codon:yes gene_type:complete
MVCAFYNYEMYRYEKFRQCLSKISESHVSETDASEAFYNLSGFMSLLIKINEREQIVPKNKSNNHENQ